MITTGNAPYIPTVAVVVLWHSAVQFAVVWILGKLAMKIQESINVIAFNEAIHDIIA